MSIYQNTYFIIPKESDYSLFEGLNLLAFFEDGFFYDHLLWESNKINYEEIEKYLFSKGFDLGESWSKDLKIFGDNDFNCIKFLIENGKITSASFRINFTTDFDYFVKSTIEFCDRFNFFIIDNDLTILENDFDKIKSNLLNSKAFGNYKKFFDKKSEK